MLRNVIDNKAVPPINPHRAKIDEAAVAVVAAEQIERKALDEFLLADAAVTRQEREGQEVHTSQGSFIVNSETGHRISDRPTRRRNDAEEKWKAAATGATAARARLVNAEKAAENWKITEDYLAAQAEQEAALTPAEREIRARRDMHQRDLASR